MAGLSRGRPHRVRRRDRRAVWRDTLAVLSHRPFPHNQRSQETTEMSGANQFPETRAKAAEQLADRYMALWNEPDADGRRRMIAELWTEDGSQILQSPQEMREIVASPGIGLAATLEARGHCELQAPATTSYEHWVGSEGLSDRARDDAQRLGDVVKFHWEAAAEEGSTAAAGLNVLVLAADGRVQRNYTFVDGA